MSVFRVLFFSAYSPSQRPPTANVSGCSCTAVTPAPPIPSVPYTAQIQACSPVATYVAPASPQVAVRVSIGERLRHFFASRRHRRPTGCTAVNNVPLRSHRLASRLAGSANVAQPRDHSRSSGLCCFLTQPTYQGKMTDTPIFEILPLTQAGATKK